MKGRGGAALVVAEDYAEKEEEHNHRVGLFDVVTHVPAKSKLKQKQHGAGIS